MKKCIICLTGILLLVLSQVSLKAQNFQDAIALSHSGKYYMAEKIFIKLIEQDKKNTSLLIASGFNNAWNKEYDAARVRFLKALQLEPANTDAAKGLAYTYLYEGNYSAALIAFKKLSDANPASQEFHFALGQAYMNLQKKIKGYAEFKRVLEINPANEEAREYIADIKSEKGILELSAMAGLSGSGGNNKFGLRQIQALYRFNSQVFAYARYDNSLALDNYFFLKNNLNTNAFIGGLYTRWHKQIGSKVEYGYRNLPEGIKQNIYQTEQVIFLPKNFVVKVGGSLITSNQSQKDWMLMSSVSVPLTAKIKIEPHYYFIHRLANEHRVLLNGSYNFSDKTDIGAGVFNGWEKNAKLNINNTVSGIYGYANIFIKGPLSGTLLGRYEKDATGRNSFIAAGGLKITLDTKKF
jgi:tetratricopeptide (TPR) repeat protein